MADYAHNCTYLNYLYPYNNRDAYSGIHDIDMPMHSRAGMETHTTEVRITQATLNLGRTMSRAKPTGSNKVTQERHYARNEIPKRGKGKWL